MKIAIDVDGVLADLMPVLNDFYNKKFGTHFRVIDYKYHDLERTWGCSKEEAVRVVDELYQSPNFLKVIPLLGSQQAVKSLSMKHELFSVTSRPGSIQNKTKRFLQNNFPKKIGNLFHTGQYISSASAINKFDLCFLEKADLLIEDCLETGISCANHGLKTFLLDSPHNQLNGEYSEEDIPKNLVRVKSWLEIVEKLR